MNKLGVFGFLAIISSIIFAQLYHNASIGGLFELSAFLIVFGGTVGAILIQSSAKQLKHALKQLLTLFSKPSNSLYEQMQLLTKWSLISHKKGLLFLEEENLESLDSFTRMGLSMIIDGRDEVILQEFYSKK